MSTVYILQLRYEGKVLCSMELLCYRSSLRHFKAVGRGYAWLTPQYTHCCRQMGVELILEVTPLIKACVSEVSGHAPGMSRLSECG